MQFQSRKAEAFLAGGSPVFAVLAATLLGLASCAQVPELDARIPPDLQGAEYPDLLPLEIALDPLPEPSQEAAQLERSLTGRRDALKSRARRLQTPVVDEDARDRMESGVAR